MILVWTFYFIGQLFMVVIIAETAIHSKLNGIDGWRTYFRARGLNVAARLFISLCLVMYLWSRADVQHLIPSSGAAAAGAGLVGFAFDAVLDKVNGILGSIMPGFHIEVPPK